ncbi:Alpha/Beta hydrolase protein [Gymnopilus junonius]|uniref:Alpha/Beta hydrolase protein n=1 Tax=Gymnopilus junonius TaxID=109634 RepID=A0A9P5NU46_GYMJU|nr:Alpha/Beta hydrolase protein [Gymnopilus junonius]
MPSVDMTYPSGAKFSFAYAIATPTSYSAEELTPGLPCIVFLHSGYIGKEVFESRPKFHPRRQAPDLTRFMPTVQFSNRDLRQFNLIAFDMRGFGDTKGLLGDEPYTPTESASDIEQLMAKLNIPPSHFFGLSNGCTVALELAVSRPDLVLSLTLCSPLSPEEPKDIADGRREVYNYWKEMNDLPQDSSSTQELSSDIVSGAAQLFYNNARTNRIEAIHQFTLQKALEIWYSSPENVHQSLRTGVDWFVKRRLIPDDSYRKIKGPVAIIHCFDDFAYPLQYAEDLVQTLQKADVPSVSLHRVPGAHYGNVTNPRRINKILYDTVASCHPELALSQLSLSPTRESHGGRLPTPFTETLRRYGYDSEDESD